MEWNYKTGGIPEELFITGNIPITKTEVRVISLSKLRLKDNSKSLDIGCGTGSVTVEMARLCPEGLVYAVDKNHEAIALTKRNINKFGLDNVEILSGKAPDVLPDILLDRIFIGGGSKDLKEIISYSHGHLRDGGVVVLNAILLESAYKTLQELEEKGFTQIECTCVNIAKSGPVKGWMMKANNPIYIISAQK